MNKCICRGCRKIYDCDKGLNGYCESCKNITDNDSSTLEEKNNLINKNNLKLIKCKDCGKDISKNAQSCPHCGNIIKKSSLLGGVFKAVLAIIMFITIISIFIVYIKNENKDTTSKYNNTLLKEEYKSSSYSEITPQRRLLFATDFAEKLEKMGIEVYLDDYEKEYIRLKSALFYNKQFRDELLTNSFLSTLSDLKFKKLTFDTGTKQYDHYID